MVEEQALSSSSERRARLRWLDGYRLAARLSARDYVVHYPRRVILLSILPRVVLQVALISYLGYYAAGPDGRTFAFIGGAAQMMAMATVVKGPLTILDERLFGTLFRARLGVLAFPGTIAARWLVYTAEGFCMSVAAVLVLAAPIGGLHLLVRLLAVTPLLALLAITTSAFGLAVGSFAITQRVDDLITNLGAYALLVFCGTVAPISAFGPIGERLVRLLPLTNGLLAVRHAVGGGAWVGDALLEVAVGSAWALIGVGLLGRHDRRARKLGTDDRI